MLQDSNGQNGEQAKRRRLALIVSKGTLDNAYPPLVMANTGASLGWEVGIFFTFYGLDIIHSERQQHLSVSPVGNPAMPPPLSGVPVKVPTLIGAMPGMTAMATTMMKGWMDEANMAPILEMLDIAGELGVRLFACNTTMGVMGVEQEDLMDGVEFAGAPTFLDFAAEADIQLFI